MNIIQTEKEDVINLEDVYDIEGFIKEAEQYSPKNEKYKEILAFLISEFKRISENMKIKDIQKYKNAIKYYILEDMGMHEEAMSLKIKFYSKGSKFPFLPMVNLFSFYY